MSLSSLLQSKDVKLTKVLFGSALDPRKREHAHIMLNFPNEKGESLSRTYKTLSLLVHPDKNPDKTQQAELAFTNLKTAYETLKA